MTPKAPSPPKKDRGPSQEHVHEARHQLDHRLTEKLSFGVTEHALETGQHTLAGLALQGSSRAIESSVEHGTEGAGERLVEHVVARNAERLGEVLAERGAERAGERLVARGSMAAVKHMAESQQTASLASTVLERAANTSTVQPSWAKRAGKWLQSKVPRRVFNKTHEIEERVVATVMPTTWLLALVQALRVVVPFAGGCLVLHMTWHDYHRVLHQREAKGPSWLMFFFVIAMLCDAFDAVVHFVVVASTAGWADIDHHLVHHLETLAMRGAVAAVLSMVVGELLCAYCERHIPTTEPTSPDGTEGKATMAKPKAD